MKGLVIGLLLLVGVPVQAARVFARLEATVVEINETGTGTAPSAVSLGHTATISFSYDSTANFYNLSERQVVYNDGLDIEMTVSLNGLTWQGQDTDGRAIILDTSPGDSVERDALVFTVSTFQREQFASFSSFPNQQTGPDTYAALVFRLDEVTPFADLLTSQELPTSLSQINTGSATIRNFEIVTENSVTGDGYQFLLEQDLTTLSLQVPEPSGLLLAVSGLLFFARRRAR